MKSLRHLIALSALLLLAATSPVSAQDGPEMGTDSTTDDSTGTVARAQVTTAVENREPVDKLEVVPVGTPTVFFFTDLRNLAGAEVRHRWSHGGQVLADVPFQVGGDRWRVWSSKELDPALAGKWELTVVDADGNRLESQSFLFEETAPIEGTAAIEEAAPMMEAAAIEESATMDATAPPAKATMDPPVD